MASTFSQPQPTPQAADLAFRTPRRLSITLPHGAYQLLLERSDREGRSLSNLAAFLLETALVVVPSPGGHNNRI